MSKIPLLYVLPAGNLYGTERMALATASALREKFMPVIVAPPGPVIHEATRLGLEAMQINGSPASLVATLVPYLLKYRRLAYIATKPLHSVTLAALNLLFRRRVAHIFVAHTNVGPWIRRLDRLPLAIVAVSSFVEQQIRAHGSRARRICVIENFLAAESVLCSPRRGAFTQAGVRNVAIIARLEPAKRLDVLLSCLERRRDLRELKFNVYGTGTEGDRLKARSEAGKLNVAFNGFRADVTDELAKSDLLLHLRPDEPCGLAVLEAIAANVPVLVPDKGGASSIVQAGVSGIEFQANNASSLGDSLAKLHRASPADLNGFVIRARTLLDTRFAEKNRIQDYLSIIQAGLSN